MAGENEDPKPDGKGDPKQDEKQKDGKKKEDGAGETVTMSKAELEKMQKALADANDEAKNHRLAGKKSTEELERLKKGWKIAMGEEPDKIDPAEMEKKRTENKMRWLIVKNAFVSLAAGEMHDAEHSFDSVADDLGELEVDVENGKVDRKAIKERLDELKKNRPYLFRQKMDPSKTTTEKTPGGQKEDGTAKDGKNPYQEWKDLFAVDKKKATEFYKKNIDAIKAGMPK